MVLFTGRVRPLDRDALVKRWKGLLKAGSTEPLKKPVVVVTTQCLEVGADFGFDALVTECASLDSLRQRFGRLDQFGELSESNAVHSDPGARREEPKNDGDPIYGKAILETWNGSTRPSSGWGREQWISGSRPWSARRKRSGRPIRRDSTGSWRHRDDAPVLLPAHLDFLCQTSPRPAPEPDVTLFLHGKGHRNELRFASFSEPT